MESMMKNALKLVLGAPILIMGLAPTLAVADPVPTYQTFNDGNGTCGTIACGAYGCSVIETHRCPREVNPDG